MSTRAAETSIRRPRHRLFYDGTSDTAQGVFYANIDGWIVEENRNHLNDYIVKHQAQLQRLARYCRFCDWLFVRTTDYLPDHMKHPEKIKALAVETRDKMLSRLLQSDEYVRSRAPLHPRVAARSLQQAVAGFRAAARGQSLLDHEGHGHGLAGGASRISAADADAGRAQGERLGRIEDFRSDRRSDLPRLRPYQRARQPDHRGLPVRCSGSRRRRCRRAGRRTHRLRQAITNVDDRRASQSGSAAHLPRWADDGRTGARQNPAHHAVPTRRPACETTRF